MMGGTWSLASYNFLQTGLVWGGSVAGLVQVCFANFGCIRWASYFLRGPVFHVELAGRSTVYILWGGFSWRYNKALGYSNYSNSLAGFSTSGGRAGETRQFSLSS